MAKDAIARTNNGATGIDLLPLKFCCDGQYQNCAEFIRAVVGLKIANLVGLDTCPILLRGDSRTALYWAEFTRFRGTRVTQVACVFIFETTIYGVDKEYTVHSPKELNTRCDDLARRMSWEMHIKRLERRTVPLLQAETDELIVVCDPKRRFCGRCSCV